MEKTNTFNSKTLLKVGIYLRLSNEDKDKLSKSDSSESIKNQRNMLMQYIAKHPEFTLAGEYCDEDLSGAGTYRPAFERLIKDCEDKKLDIVLCKSQSRFSRDMEIVEKYINNKFKEWNIRFIGLSDNADTENRGNKKARQINGLVNEWYLEDVSNNIRSAFYSKMKQGELISPFAPFGYDISPENNNKLIIDPIAATTVKDIYNLYLTGMGFTGIAKYLNRKNIPSPSLYKYHKGIKLNVISKRPREMIKWNPNQVKTILTNEVYLGHLIQGKRTTISYKNHKIIYKDKSKWIRKENTHESIIDENLFNKVQELIKKRSKPLKSSGMVHTLAGKVVCLECGHNMRKKSTRKHDYLTCYSNNSGYDDCINKASIRYDVVEEIVLKALNDLLIKYYDKDILIDLKSQNLKDQYTKKIAELQNQKIALEKEIAKTRNYLKNLYEDKVNGIIPVKEFNTLIKEYSENDNNYNKQIKAINSSIKNLNIKKQDLNNNLLNKYLHINKLTRIIVQEFIDKIYVGKINKEKNTRDIQIKWNIK